MVNSCTVRTGLWVRSVLCLLSKVAVLGGVVGREEILGETLAKKNGGKS
jgi:hypothetical protein